ncbi:MAG: ATP-binding protein [Phormidesmis sp.]
MKAFNRLRIRQKLNVGFGVMVLLTFLVVGRNAWGSLFAIRTIRQTEQVRVPTALSSSQAQQELLRMSAHIRGYLLTGNSEYRNSYYLSRQKFDQELDTMIALLATHPAADDRSQLTELKILYEQWRQIPEELFGIGDQSLENQPALRLFKDKGELALLTIQADSQALIDLQAERSPSSDSVRLLREMAAFQTSSALMGASLRAYLIVRSPDFRFDYTGKLRIANQHWANVTADPTQLTDEQQQIIAAIAQQRQQFSTLVPSLLAIAESDRFREDLFLFNTKAEPLAGELLALLDEIVVIQQLRLENELESSRSGLIKAQWQTLIGSFLALGTALVLALLLRRKIADPIVRLTRATAQVIEGNLQVKTAVESADEVGALARTFNRMTDSLQASHQDLACYNATLEAQKTELQSKNIQISQALDALQMAQFQLVQTEKMSSLGQMVAGIAHEINNPVSFIHGNLPCLQSYTTDLIHLIELYQRSYPDPNAEIISETDSADLDFMVEDIPRIFGSMQTGTQRIRDIVLSLRNFSRLDEADMKEATVVEGLESTLLILQNRLSVQSFRSAIALDKQYEDLPAIECYPGQLNQAFLNVLANAIDAIDSASAQHKGDGWQPKITLSLTPVQGQIQGSQADDKQIAIRICDNGEGMDSEVRSRIFDPFFTTKTVGDGTGMGLSITHKIIVDRHQGDIGCVSKKGVGTTISIVLPYRQSTLA